MMQPIHTCSFIRPIWFLGAIEFHIINFWWMKKTFTQKRFRSIFYYFAFSCLERFAPSVSGRQVVWLRWWNGMLCLRCQHHVDASFHGMGRRLLNGVLECCRSSLYALTHTHSVMITFAILNQLIKYKWRKNRDCSAHVLSLWFDFMVKSTVNFTYLKKIIDYYPTPMDHILSDLWIPKI